MNYSNALNELIQKQASVDPEIDKLIKEIDRIHEENEDLEQKLEESEQEDVQLQIELYNRESITSQYDKEAIEKSRQTNVKIFEAGIDLRNLLRKIDFVKIAKCKYMEMEAKCRKECEPIQESMAKIAEWHKKMEERYIVQKYRQAELAIKKADDEWQKKEELMKKDSKESSDDINKTKEKRTELIVDLIKGSQELEQTEKELQQLQQYEYHIEGLKLQKLDLMKKLELTQHKAFNINNIIPLYSQNALNTFSQNLETKADIVKPMFPSFTDILNSFQKTDAEITITENTTIRKSILRNSQNNSMELNQSITTKLTKQVRFKVPLEEVQEAQNSENEMETEETSPETSQETTIAVNETNEEEIIEETEEINMETQMETIDLLTPVNDNEKGQQLIEPEDIAATTENLEENRVINKPEIHIQEVVIFKKPVPVIKDYGEPDKENIPITSNALKFSSSSESSPCIPLNQTTTSASSFYEGFLKGSFSSDISAHTTSQSIKTKTHTKRSILKDFDTYLNENLLFLSESKENKEDNSNDEFVKTKSNINPKQVEDDTDEETTDEMAQDIIGFGSSNKAGFTYDPSDDGGANQISAFDFMLD